MRAAAPFVLFIARAGATRECALEHVLLPGDDGGDGARGWALHNCSALTLRTGSFTEAELAGLSGALSSCRHALCPTTLELDTVPLDYEGSRLLGLALANGTELRELRLNWNAVHIEGARRLTAALARNRTALTALTLEYNGISDAGATALAEHLVESNSTIRRLGLTANLITDEGAIALAAAVRANTSLVSLDLRNNSITSVGLTALVQAVEAREGVIEDLAIEGNPVANGAAAEDAALLTRLRAALEQG